MEFSSSVECSVLNPIPAGVCCVSVCTFNEVADRVPCIEWTDATESRIDDLRKTGACEVSFVGGFLNVCLGGALQERKIRRLRRESRSQELIQGFYLGQSIRHWKRRNPGRSDEKVSGLVCARPLPWRCAGRTGEQVITAIRIRCSTRNVVHRLRQFRPFGKTRKLCRSHKCDVRSRRSARRHLCLRGTLLTRG